MTYRSSFQCPDTGQTVIASYTFGRLTFHATSEDDEDIMLNTLAWCRRYTNKRFKTFNAANDYLISVSEGQSMGLEDSR